MALISLTKTEKKLAANVRNGALSNGPVTETGRKRSDGARLQHGFCSKVQSLALPVLGGDPEEFSQLLDGLRQEFAPAGPFEEQLVRRVAWTFWLMDRWDRSQEGHALARAKAADSGRENRLHARLMRLKLTAERLRVLARSVSIWHYVTTVNDLEVIKRMYQAGVMGDMGDIALALFYQLQPPNTDETGVSHHEQQRQVLERIKEIFGLASEEPPAVPGADRTPPESPASPVPDAPPEEDEGQVSENDRRYPQITEADWEARERARKLLRNILARQAEACEAERRGLLRESVAGPLPQERAAEVSPDQKEAWLSRRAQESNLRQLRRLIDLLRRSRAQSGPANSEASRQIRGNPRCL